MTDVRDGLVYAVHDGTELRGDLYLPDGRGPHPVLLAIPGGGWLRGDRKGLKQWGEYLADKGFAVFSIDHRKSVDGPVFPQNARDVLAAARFLVGRAGELGLDPDRFGVLGASAGAHLGALITLAGDAWVFASGYPDDDFTDVTPKVRALVAAYGPYDLETHWRTDAAKGILGEENLTERMLGATPDEDPQLYAEASPTHHVTPASAGALKALIAWGDSDPDISPRQSEGFAEALRGAGAEVEAIPVEGAEHFWFSRDAIDDPAGFTQALAPRIADFLRRTLGGAEAR